MKKKISKPKKQKINKKQNWVACHWIDGKIEAIGTEKEMRDFCKKKSLNPEYPIYYAYPVSGISIVEVRHDHMALVNAAKAVLTSNRAFMQLMKELE